MASTFRLAIIFTAIIIVCVFDNIRVSAASVGDYVPIIYKINQRDTECIYEQYEKSDFVTYSVFVVEALNNGPPKATVTFEGPVAGSEDVIKMANEANNNKNNGANNKDSDTTSLGRELKTGVDSHWPKVKDADKLKRYDKRIGVINRYAKVDWTHAGENEDAVASRAEIEAEKRRSYRNYGRGPLPGRNDGSEGNPGDTPEDMELHDKYRTITQAKIEPYEETNIIKASGWYRMCVSSHGHHALMVEMDMRSGKKMGGLNRNNGHVHTYEQWAQLEEEKIIDDEITPEEESALDANTYASMKEELEKELENQVRATDLSATKAQIKHLNGLVMEMKKKHVDYHHRIKVHQTRSERNYSTMAWNSKMETLMYIVISGVQLYTVRNWLLSSSMLGR